MNEKNSEQWNNGINNEEISSAKTLDNQNLSKEIKMEDDVRNRDNTIIISTAAKNCQEFRLGKTQAANLTPSNGLKKIKVTPFCNLSIRNFESRCKTTILKSKD